MNKFFGFLVLVAAFAVGVGIYMYAGKNTAPVSALPAGEIDIAIVSLQDAVLRDRLATRDPGTGDSYRSLKTLGGRMNITVSKGKYTLLTVKTNQTRYIQVVEAGMDGKVLSGFGRSFDSEQIEREFVAPTTTQPEGKGLEFREHYEQLAENLKPTFFNYFGVDPTGNKWGI